MKKITLVLTGFMLLAGITSLTAFKTLPPSRPSANGQGALDLGLAKIQHFSFHANTDNNGNVSGSFEVKSASQDVRLHGNISCLKVLTDGKTAFMSGVITQRSGDGFPGIYNVGDFVYFRVQDNGEGSNAADDKFSDVYPSGVSQYCGPSSILLLKIANGNIQVKP